VIGQWNQRNQTNARNLLPMGNIPSPPNMKPHSFPLTKKNRLAILEYSALVGCRPALFLNKFLVDFLVHQFADPFNGIKEEYLASEFSFQPRK